MNLGLGLKGIGTGDRIHMEKSLPKEIKNQKSKTNKSPREKTDTEKSNETLI